MEQAQNKIQHHSKSLATKEVVADLRKRFDVFSDIETVKSMREVFMPKIKKFSDHIDHFHQSNLEMKECIKKFDASISLKANKAALVLMKQDLQEGFITADDLVEVNSKIHGV